VTTVIFRCLINASSLFAMGIPILAMESAVAYVLTSVVLFHGIESYNFLKMAPSRSKVVPAVFCKAVNLQLFRSMIL